MDGFERITVVTPNFNHARHLEDALRSVLSQRYPGLEYFVMDGGSTDGSVEVIRRWQDRLAGWASEPDRGQAEAIQKGLRRSTGSICAWLSSTDLYLPGALAAVNRFFRAHPGIDLAYGDALIIGPDGRVEGEKRRTGLSRDSLVYERVTLSQPAVFWRRSLFERVGGFDPAVRFAVDHDLFIRMLAAGRARHLGRFVACTRIHADAISQRLKSDLEEEWRRLDAKYQDPDPRRAARRRISSTLRHVGRWLRHSNPGYAFRIACDSVFFSSRLRAGGHPLVRAGAAALRLGAGFLRSLLRLGGVGRRYETV